MKSILVGLDSSERAPSVLRAAADLAKRTGARVTLMRAVTLPVGLPPEAYAIAPDRLPALLVSDAHRQLEELAKAVPAEVPVTIRVDLGNPWQRLCEVAKQDNVDLIVIGSHGYAGLDRILGTTASHVVHHADRSVLVVRERT
jgi:nucleotide-binding universal stress UspA family protein